MAQYIELFVDKETLIKMIKKELVQDENAQALTEYKVEIFGDNYSSLYANILTQTMVAGHIGSLIERIEPSTMKGILVENLKNNLGTIKNIVSKFQNINGSNQFIGYTITIEPIMSYKSFLRKKFYYNS